MRSDSESVVAVLDRLDDAIDDLTELSFEALTTPERLRLLERLGAPVAGSPTCPDQPDRRTV